MTPLERFENYLREVERRIRWGTISKGAALAAMLALVSTVVAAWFAVQFALSHRVVMGGRLVIFLSAGGALSAGLLLPLMRINRKRAARLLEQADPGFEQRAMTIETDPDNPFSQLLAEEAMQRAAAAPPSVVIPWRRLAASGVAAAAAIAAIGWLAGGAPGELGYAAHLLWAGAPPPGSAPMFEISVRPGDAKVRRGGDLAVEARLMGFEASKVTLSVKAADGQWEGLPMESKPGEGAAWQFYLASVSQDLEYRVEAGRVKSRVYRLRVVDLPGIKQMMVRTRGPAWLGASLNAETKGGDIRAVEGSEAEVRVETDRPLEGGVLVMDDGKRVKLERGDGNWSIARLKVEREGAYFVAAESEGEVVRISEDYFIEAREEKAPEIRIARPGKDAKVSPIEEVMVEIEAADDFGLTATELRYSVNGGPEKAVNLGGARGSKENRGSALIALEDYKLQPGDVVSLYAVARDVRRSTQTDIFFLEAQPFEREYRQGQGGEMGGGMGGGQQENDEEIAQRQKEIIAATWNLLRSGKPKAQSMENAAFLSDLEQKLAAQSRSLAERMRSRQLSATNEEFQKFAKEMEQAAQAMTEASGTLRAQQWKESLPAEQKALQHLFRAQSLFRQIQVAFQRGGGGGGGGGRQGSMRDLESLFDLELDTEKNQYETAQTRGSASERAQQADEAMKKLEELARRQQQLAREQQQQKQMAEKRWAQEMLRREAEELRRKMEQLARESGQQQGQQGQEGQQGQQGQQGRQGQQSGQQQRTGAQGGGGQSQQQQMNRALRQLEQAMEDMRRAQAGDRESARRAAERMAEAGESLNSMRRQETGEQTGRLSEQAGSLARRQEEFERKLKEALGQSGAQQAAPNPRAGRQPSMNPEKAQALADDKRDIERDYRRLEQAIRNAMREMGSSNRDSASKLREALGEAQQNELGLRLKYGEEMLRKGFGSYLAPREHAVTEMMNRLSDQVKEAQQQAARGGGSPEARARKERAAQAVGELERLREQLRNLRAQQGQPGQPGQQSLQRGQQGQTGQQQGQQGGQQGDGRDQGGQRAGGDRRNTDEFSRSGYQNRGDGRSYSALNDGSLRGMEEAYARAMDQIDRLRNFEAGAGMESKEELDRLLRDMQRLDPKRFPGNPALLSALEREILPRLEQLELRLRRDLDLNPQGQVRSQQRAKAPEGYSAAVAEYYRRLSKGK